MKRKLGGGLGLWVLGLPALDFLLVVRIVYVASVPDLLSPFWALVIGCILAVVACVMFIAGQGSTLVEVAIPSLILLVLLLIVYPVAMQMPEKRRINAQKRALKEQRQRALQHTAD